MSLTPKYPTFESFVMRWAPPAVGDQFKAEAYALFRQVQRNAETKLAETYAREPEFYTHIGEAATTRGSGSGSPEAAHVATDAAAPPLPSGGAASPSEPEPGAPHDWYLDNGDIYCKRCSANHGELVSRPCAGARAAVPEEPRPAAAAPKEEDPGSCETCDGRGYVICGVCTASVTTPAAVPRARLAALEEVERHARRHIEEHGHHPGEDCYSPLCVALGRLKETK